MDTADFDQDGDPDVVLGEHRGNNNNRVIIFENTGQNSSWDQHVIDNDSKNTIDHHDGTQAVDLDNDGDLDLISVGWYNKKVWVYENKAIDGGSPTPTSFPSPSPSPNPNSSLDDLIAVLQQWGAFGLNMPEDISGDEKVNGFDAAYVIKDWGNVKIGDGLRKN